MSGDAPFKLDPRQEGILSDILVGLVDRYLADGGIDFNDDVYGVAQEVITDTADRVLPQLPELIWKLIDADIDIEDVRRKIDSLPVRSPEEQRKEDMAADRLAARLFNMKVADFRELPNDEKRTKFLELFPDLRE